MKIKVHSNVPEQLVSMRSYTWLRSTNFLGAGMQVDLLVHPMLHWVLTQGRALRARKGRIC
jgi:hypothetical protein